MINKVVLIGRLTKKPDLKRTTNEYLICKFTVACNRYTKNETQQSVDFINCICWGKTAKVLCEYMDKGSLVAVEGRLQTRRYTNAEGYTVYVTEVVVENLQFLQSKKSNSINDAAESNSNNKSKQIEPQQNFTIEDDSSATTIGDFVDNESFSFDYQLAEDDLPF